MVFLWHCQVKWFQDFFLGWRKRSSDKARKDHIKYQQELSRTLPKADCIIEYNNQDMVCVTTNKLITLIYLINLNFFNIKGEEHIIIIIIFCWV